MDTFAKKIEPVKAQRWFPDLPVEGFGIRPTEIHFSDDKQLFYITRGDDRPTCWMQTAKKPGPVATAEKLASEKNFFSKQIAQFRTPKGEQYHRDVYPFNCWKVRTNPTVEPIGEDSELYQDYVSIHVQKDQDAWLPKAPRKYVLVNATTNQAIILAPGDWLIIPTDASIPATTLTNDEFANQYTNLVVG